MLESTVKKLLDKALAKRDDLFLIDLIVLNDNQITVIIDGDKEVSVDDCIYISRAIENNLDRDEDDFSLEVTSAGAGSPLINKRQYKKNIGRTLKIKTGTENFEGTLKEVKEQHLILEWKTREHKPIGKGKITVTKQMNVAYNNIVEAKVMIKF